MDIMFKNRPFVNRLFGSKEILLGHLASVGNRELSVKITKHGEVLGSENFLEKQGRYFEILIFYDKIDP
jgi:hypothetical protein